MRTVDLVKTLAEIHRCITFGLKPCREQLLQASGYLHYKNASYFREQIQSLYRLRSEGNNPKATLQF